MVFNSPNRLVIAEEDKKGRVYERSAGDTMSCIAHLSNIIVAIIW